MISKNDWLNMIMPSLEEFIYPEKALALYEKQNMSRFYDNYLECNFIYLYEDCFLEEIEDYKNIFNIHADLLGKLIHFREYIHNFYEECSKLDNYAIMKRKEWETIIPMARECFEELQTLLMSTN